MSEHFDEGDLHDTPPVQQTALATVQPNRDTSPEGLMALAIDRGLSVEGLEKLMALAAQVREQRAKTAFMAAMASFQEQCPVIEKTRTVLFNGVPKYKFASFEDIKTVISPILGNLGLSYTFDTSTENDFMTVFCHVRHEEGHTESSSFSVPIDHNKMMSAPQQFAASVTYAKRYALINSLGLAIGDEDNDAAQPTKPQQPAQQPRQQAPPAKQSRVGIKEFVEAEADWKRFYEACPDVKMVNERISNVGNLSEPIKNMAREMTMAYTEENGFVFDREKKCYYEPTS